jgi:hypothetical protein
VRSHPACILIADEACKVVLFAILRRLDGDGSIDNPPIAVQVDAAPKAPYGDEDSAILPFDKGFPVFLDEGQQLWAVSSGESELTFTILPVPLDAVGY